MGYRNLQQAVVDLEKNGDLIRIETEISPDLEVGAIQRRVYQAGGPALLFTNICGSKFPMLGNLFGTLQRTRWLFRDTLPSIEKLVELKLDPLSIVKNPFAYMGTPLAAARLLPQKVRRGASIMQRTTIDQLPQLKSWPMDGGAFITLPQVYTESPIKGGFSNSNLGMYRVQLSGNEYRPNEEVGLHYQIHRGIGVHHAQAIEQNRPLRVNIFVGGAPAMTVAAVMPLPEGMPELSFAGVLSGERIKMVKIDDYLPIPAEADFCICGTIDPKSTKPEGPFGDHLGYYSLQHEFPVVKVDAVYHRPDAIWPFTTVGRPPQEDTSFGTFIHELTGALIPTVLPGIKAVHAVDAAGVHPLLLAIGAERYVPYAKERRPQELLTMANAILGQGQLSLAKYLLIVAEEDNRRLDIHNVSDYFQHLLKRVDWRYDCHFQTSTTIDTLDYSGSGLNRGSKIVIAAAGPEKRTLSTGIPADFTLPDGFDTPSIALPGIIAIHGPTYNDSATAKADIQRLCEHLSGVHANIDGLPLIVVVDDPLFTAKTLNNLIWTLFTRSNPAADINGVGASCVERHWGCTGPLVIDARIKPHHAPPLIDDPSIEKRVDQLGAPGGPLHGII